MMSDWCEQHADYEAKGRPTSDCERCWQLWYYRNPAPESARVAGLLCFYNEKVDIELDGKMLDRPRTVFS